MCLPSFADGVVKVDPSGLNGRKGTSISFTVAKEPEFTDF